MKADKKQHFVTNICFFRCRKKETHIFTDGVSRCEMLYIYVNFNNFVSKKMKKRTTLELVEQSKRVSLYSISFEMDRTTEFERFIRKFEAEASLNKVL